MVLFVFATRVTAEEKASVTIYLDENVPPYSYRQNGQLVGIYPDLIKNIANVIPSFNVNIEPIPWTRGLALMEYGQGFALSPIYHLPDERPYIGAYSKPLLGEEVAIFCNRSVSERLDKPVMFPRSFHGLYIAVHKGYHLGNDTFWQSVREGRIKAVVSGKDPRANLQMLHAKRVDCYLHIQLSVTWTANEMLQQGIFENLDWLVLVNTLDEKSAFVGFTSNTEKFPFRDDFVEMFNQELVKQQENGLLDKIESLYKYQ